MTAKSCQIMDYKDSKTLNNSLKSTNKRQVPNITQFELCKLIYDSEIMGKIKLSPTTKLVLIALANHFPNVFPSQRFLAQRLGIGLTSVKRAIIELKNKGLIVYETKKVNNYTFTNLFFNALGLINNENNNIKQGHNETFHETKMDYKQTKEKRNKITYFKKNFTKQSYNNSHKKKYEHNTHEQGIKYKKWQKEDIIKGSPLDFTKKQAVIYLDNMPEIFKNRSYFAKELIKKWNL